MIGFVFAPRNNSFALWLAFVQTHLAQTIVSPVDKYTLRFVKSATLIFSQHFMLTLSGKFKECLADNPIPKFGFSFALLPVIREHQNISIRFTSGFPPIVEGKHEIAE